MAYYYGAHLTTFWLLIFMYVQEHKKHFSFLFPEEDNFVRLSDTHLMLLR